MKQESITRRQFIATSMSLATLPLIGGTLAASAVGKAAPSSESWGLSLPELPYAPDALEPYIDAITMTIHHGKHHAAYVQGIINAFRNAGIDPETDPAVLSALAPTLPKSVQTAARNHGGGHYNHCHFWESMSPTPQTEPDGRLAREIANTFGSLESFQLQFKESAMSRFGSGWAWLIATPQGLVVTSTPNQDNPLMADWVEQAGIPLLGIDVWEHAYYLKYQNRRGDYIDAWWNVVDWAVVQRRFDKATLPLS